MVPQIIKRKQNHMVPMWFPCDSTINHKEILSHGAHDISQCTMTKLWNPTTQLTPLNNYISNCVITSSYIPTIIYHTQLSKHNNKNFEMQSITCEKSFVVRFDWFHLFFVTFIIWLQLFKTENYINGKYFHSLMKSLVQNNIKKFIYF